MHIRPNPSLLLATSFAALALFAGGCRRAQVGSFEACTPDETLQIGCDGTIGPRCTGDPTLTVCDATGISDPEACTRSGTYLAYNDDSAGTLCPALTTTCPASGMIAINPNPYSSRSTAWSCDYRVLHSAVGP